MHPTTIEASKFKDPPHLHPHHKANRPFHTWCVDLMTNLTPAGPNGEVHAIVAVDPFTKWVELGAISDKSSATVTSWFHREITCRFGTPAIVRVDQGTEFMGAFKDYLDGLGIKA
jgi:hypothetical protein